MNSKTLLRAMQTIALQIRQLKHESDYQPFPFLDLPKELRLIIYEYIAHLHRHDEISIPVGRNHASITLVTPLPVPSIHLACRLIHSEASPFLKKRLRQTTRTIPRIIIPAAHAMRLAKYDGLIEEILNWLFHVRFNRNLLPSNEMKDEFGTRFPSIKPNQALAAASIGRLANVGGVHMDAFSEKLANFDWVRFRFSECAVLKRLAKERQVAIGESSAEWELHILIKDEGCVDLQALLRRLGARAKDYSIRIVVYRMQKEEMGNDFCLSGQQWAWNGGVVSGRMWLQDWA